MVFPVVLTGGVIVSVLASSAGRPWVRAPIGSNQRLMCCFSTQHTALRRKQRLVGTRLMCLSGATCLSAECCFSELAISKIQLSMLV